MKTFFALMIAAAVFASCNNTEMKNKVDAKDPAAKAEGETPSAATAESYAVQKDRSVVNWKGVNKIVGKEHVGTMVFSDGTVQVADNQVTGGKFTADMTSIASAGDKFTDGEKKVGMLIGHLKSPDFFDVQNFPTSTFEIVSVTPVAGKEGVTHDVKGNLTIKGITKEVTVPANISFNGNEVSAKTTFTIDRSQWDVRYGSTSFFDNLGDGVIENNVELQLDVVAVKPQA